MAQVWVIVNGRRYAITCDDGQEEHVSRLAAELNRRVSGLVSAMGQVGQERLLLLASLLLADELADKPRVDAASVSAPRAEPALGRSDAVGAELQDLAQRIEAATRRLQPGIPQPAAGPSS